MSCYRFELHYTLLSKLSLNKSIYEISNRVYCSNIEEFHVPDILNDSYLKGNQSLLWKGYKLGWKVCIKPKSPYWIRKIGWRLYWSQVV